MREVFNRFARWAADVTGSAWMFLVATVIILVWGVTGPIFHYSDTWQLVINTGTTIITFLMVFLIQNTQNRDAKAMHLKLDELIRIHKLARNSMIELEQMTDEELGALQQEFTEICSQGDVLEGGAVQAMHQRLEEETRRRSRSSSKNEAGAAERPDARREPAGHRRLD